MVFYGGMCEINSAMCVFVWLIYRAYKVMFIGPAQIIKQWTFKCNIHLMQKQDVWKYYLVKLELSPKSKSQIIYIHKSILKTSHLREVHIRTGWSERNVGGGCCCCSQKHAYLCTDKHSPERVKAAHTHTHTHG